MSKSLDATYHRPLDNEEETTVLHVEFEPADDPSAALGADTRVGVSEVVFYHFPRNLASTDAINESIDKMRPVVERSQALAVFDRWAMKNEDDIMAKTQVYVNLLGWVDVEAHMEFQASDDFKQNVHHLTDIKELQQFEMHHVKVHGV
ncbi:MAG: hypothetical protein Q9225_002271 [Loekoesia sp. 1 TL-2023]